MLGSLVQLDGDRPEAGTRLRRRWGKAVAAGIAGLAPPEPYVPGSGARFLRSFGWCWVDTSVLLVVCSLAPGPRRGCFRPFHFLCPELSVFA
jgi:hypothetical protein